MANPDLGWGLLNRPLVPAGKTTTAVGYGLLLAGMLFAGLGAGFSGRQLELQRHPQAEPHPGALRTVPDCPPPDLHGTARGLAGHGNCPWADCAALSGVMLAAIAWKIKSITEEAFMVQQFGEQYTRYRTEVKALVPYIW